MPSICRFFFFSSRRRHTRFSRDWSSDVCSSDLGSSYAQLRGIFDCLKGGVEMSQQSNTVYKTFIAGADLTGKENLFVELTGEYTVGVCNAATDVPIGVLTDYYRAAQGQSVTVAIGGTVRVKAGGAISAGAWVGTDGNGKAVAK